MPNKQRKRAGAEKLEQPQTTFRVVSGELVGVSSKGVGTKAVAGKEWEESQYVRILFSPPPLLSPPKLFAGERRWASYWC